MVNIMFSLHGNAAYFSLFIACTLDSSYIALDVILALTSFSVKIIPLFFYTAYHNYPNYIGIPPLLLL